MSPKLSSDHIPGSNTKSPDAASPHATKFVVLVTVSPAPCDAGEVPLTSLVTPVNSLDELIPVYDISSVPIFIKFVPESGNCDTSANVIPVVVVELIAPDKVVVGSPAVSPPHDQRDQPKPFACTAGPTG